MATRAIFLVVLIASLLIGVVRADYGPSKSSRRASEILPQLRHYAPGNDSEKNVFAYLLTVLSEPDYGDSHAFPGLPHDYYGYWLDGRKTHVDVYFVNGKLNCITAQAPNQGVELLYPPPLKPN